MATGRDALNPAIEFHVVNDLGWPRLRSLQQAAIAPVRSGADCLLLAPTAGGKTEAATFPLLSSMVEEDWRGLTVLYVTPLRALLNNLHPRLEKYGAWLGRTVGLWHGDIGDAQRRRLLAEPPDILLTTPESLEAMLVSRRVDHHRLFGRLRSIVVDELHSFAASDRGWHLLGVLARLEQIAGHPIQRVGLSATVGNPDQIGQWLQGDPRRALRVVIEEASEAGAQPDVTLDYVGSDANAARVIAALHRGEKRLVFCESRRKSEHIARALRDMGIETFVSHSSLSADERRRSEAAFAEAQDTVIVATSTLELGIDIGDLDRVIQIDAPRTVASFLQRLGRTGRRPGTLRNTLFLATDSDAFLEAAGLLLLWGRGFVEPVLPPPYPLHLVAQQLLALALQEGAYDGTHWPRWWSAGTSGLMDDAPDVLAHLRAAGFLVEDGGQLMIGPAAEKAFGRRHFMDLLTSFSAERELRVVVGTKEVGFISPLALPHRDAKGDRKAILMNGHAWQVEDIDWRNFTVQVSQASEVADVRWQSAPIALSFELMRAQREVVLGATPDVPLTQRARACLERVREHHAPHASDTGLVAERRGDEVRLWTWAGLKANETLRAALGSPDGRSDNAAMTVSDVDTVSAVKRAVVDKAVPYLPVEMARELKFSAALPLEQALHVLANRFTDTAGAADVINHRLVLETGSP